MAETCCNGSCCAGFWLSKESVAKYHQRSLEGDRDAITVRDMLVPLTAEEFMQRRYEHPGVRPSELTVEMAKAWEGELWTCWHFDETTRRCLIYSGRPKLCAEYPYGKPCNGCNGVNQYIDGELVTDVIVQIGTR